MGQHQTTRSTPNRVILFYSKGSLHWLAPSVVNWEFEKGFFANVTDGFYLEKCEGLVESAVEAALDEVEAERSHPSHHPDLVSNHVVLGKLRQGVGVAPLLGVLVAEKKVKFQGWREHDFTPIQPVKMLVNRVFRL